MATRATDAVRFIKANLRADRTGACGPSPRARRRSSAPRCSRVPAASSHRRPRPPRTTRPSASRSASPSARSRALGHAADGTLTIATAQASAAQNRAVLSLLRRAPGQRSFGAPSVIVDEPGHDTTPTGDVVPKFTPVYAAAPGGGREVVAWLSGVAGPRLLVRTGDRSGFQQAEEIALPPRLPAAPGNESLDPAARGLVLDAAIAPDGTLALALCDDDRRAGTTLARLWVRPPGGTATWTISGRCSRSVALEAGPDSRIDALWSGAPDGGAPNAPRQIWTLSREPGAGAFGARRSLSIPGRDADNGIQAPELLLSPSGEALALWNGVPGAGMGLVNDIFAAIRGRDGVWGPPERLDDGNGMAWRPSATFSAAGDLVVAWDQGMGMLRARARRAGGSFGRTLSAPFAAGSVQYVPIGLDARGTLLAVRAERTGLRVTRLQASGDSSVTRLPNALRGFPSNPFVLTDTFANGLVLWTRVSTIDRHAEIFAASYSAASPVMRRVQVRTNGRIRVAVNEPARLTVTVRSARRSAKQTFPLVTSGTAQVLQTRSRVRALLRAKGTRRVTIQARDGGARVTTVRKVLRAR